MVWQGWRLVRTARLYRQACQSEERRPSLYGRRSGGTPATSKLAQPALLGSGAADRHLWGKQSSLIGVGNLLGKRSAEVVPTFVTLVRAERATLGDGPNE